VEPAAAVAKLGDRAEHENLGRGVRVVHAADLRTPAPRTRLTMPHSTHGLVASPSDVTRQVKNLGAALPAEVQHFLVYQLTQIVNANNAGVSIVTVAAILLARWSPSSGIAALACTSHALGSSHADCREAWQGAPTHPRHNPVPSVVLFVTVAVPPLVSDAFGTAGRIVFGVLRWFILAAVMVVGIGLLYRFAVEKGSRGWLGFLTTGTVVARSAGWSPRALFRHTANFASYDKSYAALASIVILLLRHA
jgi:membrane protein